MPKSRVKGIRSFQELKAVSRRLAFNEMTGPILEKRNHVRQKPCIKGLTILKGNDDLLGLVRTNMRVERLQVIIEVSAALLTKYKTSVTPAYSQPRQRAPRKPSLFAKHSHPSQQPPPQTLRHP